MVTISPCPTKFRVHTGTDSTGIPATNHPAKRERKKEEEEEEEEAI